MSSNPSKILELFVLLFFFGGGGGGRKNQDNSRGAKFNIGPPCKFQATTPLLHNIHNMHTMLIKYTSADNVQISNFLISNNSWIDPCLNMHANG